VFHPESSRVAAHGLGGRYGLAQSVFQVGGKHGPGDQPPDPRRCWWRTLRPAFHRLVWRARLCLGIFILFQHRHLVQASRPGAKSRAIRRAISSLPKKQGSQTSLGHSAVADLFQIRLSSPASAAIITTFYLIHTFGHIGEERPSASVSSFWARVGGWGTLLGGPLGDKIGRKYVIWFSILGDAAVHP